MFQQTSTSVQNWDYEHLRTEQTGCGCLFKYTLHSKVVRVLYTCTVAHCTDGHRFTNSVLSTSVILKTELRVLNRLCDCKQHSEFYTHNKYASLVTTKKKGKYSVHVLNSPNKMALTHVDVLHVHHTRLCA